MLIYNGKNSAVETASKGSSQIADAAIAKVPQVPGSDDAEAQFAGDPKVRAGAYSVGEALFSAADPGKLLDRTDRPLLSPVWPYERNGQYNAGTVFAEGLVPFQGQWLLYYGAADSVVGVARAELK